MIADHEQIICRVDEIEDPGARGFLPGERQDQVFVVRRDGGIYVYLNLCPHQAQALELRKDHYLNAAKTEVICYAHGAHFDIASGECIDGVCEGQFLIEVPHRIEDGQLVIGRELPAYRH